MLSLLLAFLLFLVPCCYRQPCYCWGSCRIFWWSWCCWFPCSCWHSCCCCWSLLPLLKLRHIRLSNYWNIAIGLKNVSAIGLSDYRTVTLKKISHYRFRASINRTIGYRTYDKLSQLPQNIKTNLFQWFLTWECRQELYTGLGSFFVHFIRQGVATYLSSGIGLKLPE